MKHTPKPWKKCGLTVKTADGLVICEVENNVNANYDNSAEIEANVQLIAEAPALLEACEIAEGAINDYLNGKDAIGTSELNVFRNDLEALRKVITQAKGATK